MSTCAPGGGIMRGSREMRGAPQQRATLSPEPTPPATAEYAMLHAARAAVNCWRTSAAPCPYHATRRVNASIVRYATTRTEKNAVANRPATSGIGVLRQAGKPVPPEVQRVTNGRAGRRLSVLFNGEGVGREGANAGRRAVVGLRPAKQYRAYAPRQALHGCRGV